MMVDKVSIMLKVYKAAVCDDSTMSQFQLSALCWTSVHDNDVYNLHSINKQYYIQSIKKIQQKLTSFHFL